MSTRYSWLAIAYGERGVKEITGIATHTPRILEYHAMTTLKAKQDEVPWCSSFVNWVMDRAGYPITKSAAAKSWMNWGREVPLQVGAIAILKRKGGHHVGFIVEETPQGIKLLGGNQSDAVNIKIFPKTLLISTRFPEKLTIDDAAIYEVMGLK